MLLDERILNCVAFVAGGGDTEDGTVRGTAFFIIHPIQDTNRGFLYCVTARHVVEKAAERDGHAYFRLNRQDGTYEWQKTGFADWEMHDDERVDVAVLSLNWSHEDTFNKFDHRAIGTDTFLTNELIESFKILPGENLFFPGLLVSHPGTRRNIPILRIGSIAAMPREPIATSSGMAMAYLAEIRSTGGHSGSPVFVDRNTLETKGAV